MESHLQLHIDDNIRAGMAPAEARRDALLKLGGVEPTKERCRDQHGIPLLDSLRQDLVYAARTLSLRRPIATARTTSHRIRPFSTGAPGTAASTASPPTPAAAS